MEHVKEAAATLLQNQVQQVTIVMTVTLVYSLLKRFMQITIMMVSQVHQCKPVIREVISLTEGIAMMIIPILNLLQIGIMTMTAIKLEAHHNKLALSQEKNTSQLEGMT